MIEELIACDDSRIPVVWFVTHEEARAESEITMHATRTKGKVWIWSLTSNNGTPGWEHPRGVATNDRPPFDEDESASPEGAIKAVIDYAHGLEEKVERDEAENSRVIAIFRDPHVFLQENMSFVRTLRDACRELKDTEGLIVCVSPVDKLPTDLKTDVAVIHPGLPSKDTIKTAMKAQLEDFDQGLDKLEDLTEACVGLTLNQAADALAKSITQYDGVDINFISGVKTKAISAVPGLTYIGEAPSMDKVGGLQGLKQWLSERKRGFSEEAEEEGLPKPRGVLCIGVSGCGKSLIAKACADYFGFPLLRFNPPDVKGGIVGETEGNIRLVQDSIESLGNSVSWIDEFEKGLPKQGVRNSDGGTSDALLQGILTWMQERKGGAFVVATANDISALPPELLRKGRWDAIFFVDLPSHEERVEIFNIHLKMRNWDLPEEDVKRLAQASEYYSGAEIEAACIDGKWKAFGRGEALTAEDILECLRNDIPLYQTMEEQIKDLRQWAEDRARPASISKKATIKKRKKSNKPGGRKISLKSMEKVKEDA